VNARKPALRPELGPISSTAVNRRRHGRGLAGEQKQPVRRRVALKLIKAGMNTREVTARFEAERKALALMGHASIAEAFDASTPQGAPHLAM
jgi:hypothetical protein